MSFISCNLTIDLKRFILNENFFREHKFSIFHLMLQQLFQQENIELKFDLHRKQIKKDVSKLKELKLKNNLSNTILLTNRFVSSKHFLSNKKEKNIHFF
jgi:hypothetical protein